MSTPFQFLKEIDNDSIVTALVDEHPQTIAVVVSCMQPSQAACVIESIPPERQLQVIMRIAFMRQIEQTVITLLEVELKNKISNKERIKLGGIGKVIETLSAVEPTTRGHIIRNLSLDDPDIVGDIIENIMDNTNQ